MLLYSVYVADFFFSGFTTRLFFLSGIFAEDGQRIHQLKPGMGGNLINIFLTFDYNIII